MFQALDKRLVVPDRQYFSGIWLDKAIDTIKDLVKKQIKNLFFVSGCADGWTDSKGNKYLGLLKFNYY